MSELLIAEFKDVNGSVAALRGQRAVDLPRESWGYQHIKRTLDIVAAGTGLLLLSPLFLAVALMVKIDSRGPAFFSQQRVGKDGRLFQCWKFRSMCIEAESRKAALLASNELVGGPTFKIRRDPRITRVGRWLRRASIDELPQLWNVFVGDMSLVGPRPAVPGEVAKYSQRERQRLAVVPGITCLWQVCGRSELPFDAQVRLDIEYIDTRSLRTDLLILLRTIPAVLSARGAY